MFTAVVFIIAKQQIKTFDTKSAVKLTFLYNDGGCENSYKLSGRQFGNMR